MKKSSRYLSVLLIASALAFSWGAPPAPVFAASTIGGQFQLWGGFFHLLGGFFRFGVVAATTAPPIGCPNDGQSNAPATTVQLPSLLSGYVQRSPCNVAGVDYAVGMKPNVTISIASPAVFTETAHNHIAGDLIVLYAPTGCILPSPLTAGTSYYVTNINGAPASNTYQLSATSGTSGAAINTTGTFTPCVSALKDATNQATLARVLGTSSFGGSDYLVTYEAGGYGGNTTPTWLISNDGTTKSLTIDGWNMAAIPSYIGGGFSTLTFQNNLWNVTAAAVAGISNSTMLFNGSGTTNNLVFNYNVVNGGGYNAGLIQFITAAQSGTMTLEYNWFNSPSGVVNGEGASALTYKYNLVQNVAEAYPTHTNYLEWDTNATLTSSADIEFNTTYQQLVASDAPGEGFQLYDNNNRLTFSSVTVAYNTMIASPTNPVSAARQNSHAYNVGDTFTIPSGDNANLPFFFVVTAGTSGASGSSAGEKSWSPGTNCIPITDDGTLGVCASNASMSYLFDGNAKSAGQMATLSGPGLINNNYYAMTPLVSSGTPPSGASGAYYPGSFANTYGTWTFGTNYLMTGGTCVYGSC